jgi:hypothetical protein
MASRTGRLMTGMAIGAAPGIALFFIGIIVGGEAALSFGVIGTLLAIVGVVVGAVISGSRRVGRGKCPDCRSDRWRCPRSRHDLHSDPACVPDHPRRRARRMVHRYSRCPQAARCFCDVGVTMQGQRSISVGAQAVPDRALSLSSPGRKRAPSTRHPSCHCRRPFRLEQEQADFDDARRRPVDPVGFEVDGCGRSFVPEHPIRIRGDCYARISR